MQRVANGTQEVVSRLRQDIDEVRLNSPVREIERHSDHVQIYDGNGHTEAYEHVVVAAQANHALGMLKQAPEAEIAALSAFAYERAHVVMHRDERLAPQDLRLCRPTAGLSDLESLDNASPRAGDRPGLLGAADDHAGDVTSVTAA